MLMEKMLMEEMLMEEMVTRRVCGDCMWLRNSIITGAVMMQVKNAKCSDECGQT